LAGQKWITSLRIDGLGLMQSFPKDDAQVWHLHPVYRKYWAFCFEKTLLRPGSPASSLAAAISYHNRFALFFAIFAI